MITDRNIYPEPQIAPAGRAGTSYVDPIFGTKITRITDDEFSKSIGRPGRSWVAGSSAEQNTWSKDSSAFIVGGLGKLINQDTAPDSTWDDMQFVIRNLDGSDSRKNLIDPVMRPARNTSLPGQVGQDSHLSWNNHSGGNEPVLVSAYREANNPDVFRPWMGVSGRMSGLLSYRRMVRRRNLIRNRPIL